MRRDATQAATVWDLPGARAPARSRAREEGRSAAPWRAFWASRLIVWLAGAAAAGAWGLSARVGIFDPGAMTRPFGPVGDAVAAPLARWDSVWYLAIANDGYPADDVRRAAFFPLYPLLVRAAGTVVGSPLIGGALVSTACFAVALVLMQRLTALELGPRAAGPAVWALALFPGAVFFSAVYSEALYLMLSVGCLYAARTERWAWAGAAGALAAGTRSAGVLLLVPLVLMWLARMRGRRRPADLAWLALVPLGPLAFSVSLAAGGSDAFAWLHVQDTWHREFAGPFAGVAHAVAATWDGVHHLADPEDRHDVVLFAFLLLAVPAVIGVIRRLPAAYGAYVVCALALPLSYPVGPQPLMSVPRFLAVLFPLFMWLGLWLSEGGRGRRAGVLVPSAAGLAAASAVVSTWHWFA